jgi:hypothetical protein
MENITANSSVSGNPSPSERGGETALEVPKLLADNYENHSNQNKLEMKIGTRLQLYFLKIIIFVIKYPYLMHRL